MKLRLEHVLSFRNKNDKLQHISSFPKTIDDAYEKLWNRIVENDIPYAIRIISWLFYARRPLHMEELQVAEALSAGRDVERLCADAFTSCEDIQECCRGLVVWDKSSDRVTFLHQTVQQYLAKKVMRELLPVDNIAGACLTYLGFKEFDNPCLDHTSVKYRAHQYKFALYAGQFWGIHTRELAEDSCESQRVLLLLASQNKRNSIWQLNQYSESSEWYFLEIIINPTVLHLLAQEGLSKICRILLNRTLNGNDLFTQLCHLSLIDRIESERFDVNAEDTRGETALHTAARFGQIEMVKLLLDAQVHVNAQNKRGWTALHMAARFGQIEVVKLQSYFIK